jgi:hypothetical protein
MKTIAVMHDLIILIVYNHFVSFLVINAFKLPSFPQLKEKRSVY